MEYNEPSTWPYPQHPTEHKVIACNWHELGRDGLGQKLTIGPLIGLAPWNKGDAIQSSEYTYGPVMLAGFGIEIDPGAGITYFKILDPNCSKMDFRENCERADY